MEWDSFLRSRGRFFGATGELADLHNPPFLDTALDTFLDGVLDGVLDAPLDAV